MTKDDLSPGPSLSVANYNTRNGLSRRSYAFSHLGGCPATYNHIAYKSHVRSFPMTGERESMSMH
jgi:hypothetical protein